MKRLFLLSLLVTAALPAFAQTDRRNNAVPLWHSDGRIFFMSHREGSGAVYSVKSDGTGLKLLVKSVGDNYPPRWSPNGKTGVFMTKS